MIQQLGGPVHQQVYSSTGSGNYLRMNEQSEATATGTFFFNNCILLMKNKKQNKKNANKKAGNKTISLGKRRRQTLK